MFRDAFVTSLLRRRDLNRATAARSLGLSHYEPCSFFERFVRCKARKMVNSQPPGQYRPLKGQQLALTHSCCESRNVACSMTIPSHGELKGAAKHRVAVLASAQTQSLLCERLHENVNLARGDFHQGKPAEAWDKVAFDVVTIILQSRWCNTTICRVKNSGST